MLARKCVTCHFIMACLEQPMLMHTGTTLTMERLRRAIRDEDELAFGLKLKHGPSTECARRFGLDFVWIESVTPCGNDHCPHALDPDGRFCPGAFNLQRLDVFAHAK
ncbi:hypothetical protein V8E36_003617 [Tilletia maclaganii]